MNMALMTIAKEQLGLVMEGVKGWVSGGVEVVLVEKGACDGGICRALGFMLTKWGEVRVLKGLVRACDVLGGVGGVGAAVGEVERERWGRLGDELRVLVKERMR